MEQAAAPTITVMARSVTVVQMVSITVIMRTIITTSKVKRQTIRIVGATRIPSVSIIQRTAVTIHMVTIKVI